MISDRQLSGSASGAGRFAAVAAAILLALCLAPQLGAQGGFNGPGRYEISNLKSGKVLELDRKDQIGVIQFSSRGTDSQAWDIRAAGGGFYSLQNVTNGNALGAAGTENSTPVQVTRFDGGIAQQWRFDAGKDGNALIVSRLGKTLDIAGAATSDGARVQTYEGNGDSNQRFSFRLVSGIRPGGSNGNAAGNVVTIYPAAERANPAVGNRTELKPGWNMFSPQQDVEMGQQASAEVAGQVLLLNDSRVDNYLNSLGQRLAANAPGAKYPYTFKTVNDKGINAFALPGGFVYVNRGVIETADNEAQLASVMAHEISHVALRHGTNQASKASVAQMPLAILGGLLGGDSTAAALAQLGAGFTVNSILLKYSRDAESQADLMGTQILFDSGLDPRAMGQFFGKLQGENGIAFFNSHPNPDSRIERVNEEAAGLGVSQNNSRNASQEFDQIKRYVQSLPAPRPNQLQSQQQPNASSSPNATSDRFVTFENRVLRMSYPDNWKTYGQGDAVTISPPGGMVSDGNGNQAMAYGVLVNVYAPHSGNYGRQLQGPGYGQGSGPTLEDATDQLVQDLRQSNQNLRVVRSHEPIDVGGQNGLSTYLSNDSPIAGARETNWLVTVPQLDGVLFFVFTAPEREFQGYESAFQRMLYSARVSR